MKKEHTEPTTIYTLKAKRTKVVLEFEYDLNGVLKSFTIREGILEDKQIMWLFNYKVFPYLEGVIKLWETQHKKEFEFIVGKPDLSFDTFWELYNYKLGKQNSIKQWDKLSERDKIEAIRKIKAYNSFLVRKGHDRLYPERYLKYRAFENQYGSY